MVNLLIWILGQIVSEIFRQSQSFIPFQMTQIPLVKNQNVIYHAINTTAVRIVRQRAVCGVVPSSGVWRPTPMWPHFSTDSVRSGPQPPVNVLVSGSFEVNQNACIYASLLETNYGVGPSLEQAHFACKHWVFQLSSFSLIATNVSQLLKVQVILSMKCFSLIRYFHFIDIFIPDLRKQSFKYDWFCKLLITWWRSNKLWI